MRREKVRKVYRLVLPDKRCIMMHIISILEKIIVQKLLLF